MQTQHTIIPILLLVLISPQVVDAQGMGGNGCGYISGAGHIALTTSANRWIVVEYVHLLTPITLRGLALAKTRMCACVYCP